jgi:hypothetical protein
MRAVTPIDGDASSINTTSGDFGSAILALLPQSTFFTTPISMKVAP